jgi:hypothetical protein
MVVSKTDKSMHSIVGTQTIKIGIIQEVICVMRKYTQCGSICKRRIELIKNILSEVRLERSEAGYGK